MKDIKNYISKKFGLKYHKFIVNFLKEQSESGSLNEYTVDSFDKSLLFENEYTGRIYEFILLDNLIESTLDDIKSRIEQEAEDEFKESWDSFYMLSFFPLYDISIEVYEEITKRIKGIDPKDIDEIESEIYPFEEKDVVELKKIISKTPAKLRNKENEKFIKFYSNCLGKNFLVELLREGFISEKTYRNAEKEALSNFVEYSVNEEIQNISYKECCNIYKKENGYKSCKVFTPEGVVVFMK